MVVDPQTFDGDVRTIISIEGDQLVISRKQSVPEEASRALLDDPRASEKSLTIEYSLDHVEILTMI